jgi:hypothetical protein
LDCGSLLPLCGGRSLLRVGSAAGAGTPPHAAGCDCHESGSRLPQSKAFGDCTRPPSVAFTSALAQAFTLRLSSAMRFLLSFLLAAPGLFAMQSIRAGDLTRAEVIAVARSYAEFQWEGRAANVRNGPDSAGITVVTPSVAAGEEARPGYWMVGQTNAGMPYKWGGFDTTASFAAGVRDGKAAGDLYNPGKRAKADAAVSSDAVGVDCSGFISRCWKLPKKYGTSTLTDLCTVLRSPAELKPGDVMNYAGGHVVLFVRWLDEEKDHAAFYEAEPYSKVRLLEHSTKELFADGFKPLRYKKIKD